MPDPSPDDLKRGLLTARMLWAGLLGGELAMSAIVVGLVVSGRATPQAPQLAGILTGIAAFMALSLVPLGYFLRGQIYKRGWHDHAITRGAYTSGNLMLWALCEGIVMFGLMAMLITGAWVALAVVAAAALAQILNYPTGRPMQPAYSPWERRPTP